MTRTVHIQTHPAGSAVMSPGRNAHPSVAGVLRLVGVWLMLQAPVHGAPTATVTVAAAADLAYCLQDLDEAFVAQHAGWTLKVSLGSSGNFYAQIRDGAPFDVFLSADRHYPEDLIQAGQAVRESLLIYATGKLVLWTNQPENVDVTRGLELLRDTRAVQKLAIANPDHAPYGRAAKAALQNAGLWDQIQPRLVIGENIAQTAQYVETKNADAGLVALALVRSPRLSGIGKYVEIDARRYPRLDQAAVITQQGARNPAAAAFMEFLRSDAARAIFDRYGFARPGAD
ncbi:MAG: molybdate ABC transporter substrate-binding protein [Verrucomicrobia bacterium]|nr:molybdate ABC transporter substrate-binding protein [Verrucomicrobiota bacterium]